MREEVKRIMGFWIQLGASGFRIDAAPFVLELVEADVDPGSDGLDDPGRLAAGRAVAPR